MNSQHLAGIIIIAGFIVFWIGNISSPPNVYTESDLQTRLDIVERYSTRWAISQGLGGVGIAMIAVGLGMYGLKFRQDRGLWLTWLPAVMNAAAVVLAAAYLYGYINDPASSWGAVRADPLLKGMGLLMLGAGLLYGILFLQTGLSAWIAYLSIGITILGTGALLFFNPPTFYVVSIYLFTVLAAGITMLRA